MKVGPLEVNLIWMLGKEWMLEQSALTVPIICKRGSTLAEFATMREVPVSMMAPMHNHPKDPEHPEASFPLTPTKFKLTSVFVYQKNQRFKDKFLESQQSLLREGGTSF